MVEVFIRPDWIVIAIVVALIAIVLMVFTGIVLELKQYTSWTGKLSVACTILFISTIGFTVIASSGFLDTSEKANNPLNIAEEQKDSATINPEEIENAIIENSDLDKVMLEESNKQNLFEVLSNGDFAEFTALKNGQKIEGTVYFTEKSLVINVAIEDDNVEVVEVPAE